MISELLDSLGLLPVGWQGVVAVAEIMILLNILRESRHHKREILARKRSEQLQFYAYFWKKYDRILESLPISIFDEDFRLEDAKDPDTLMVSLRSYFDLCTQEFFMHQQGLIEEVIWENWSRGLLACMELEVFKQAYSRLKVEMSHPEFHSWLVTEKDKRANPT